MSKSEKIWGIVPAAGLGKRMMSAQPKQYLPLCERRVLDHALLALCRSASVDGVIVGIREGDREWRAQPFAHAKLRAVSAGGEHRAHTVLNALRHLLQDGIAAADDWAMVHDAVRPCVAPQDIERLVTAARAHGNGALLALRVTDTLKRAHEGVIERTLGGGGGGDGGGGDDNGNGNDNGEEYWRALTPQMFRCEPLMRALQHALECGIAPTDESAAMERTGIHPTAVPGHPANIKITVASDLELAALYFRGKAQ